MKNKAVIFLTFFLLIGLVGGCQTDSIKPNTTPNNLESQQVENLTDVTPTLPDPHNHIVNINNNSLGEDNIEEFQMIELSTEIPSLKENIVLNPDETFSAFFSCMENCKVYINETTTGKTFELISPSFLTTRLFSDLVWVTNDILVFDQWAQPHYGIHYAVNVSNRELILASPFTDQVQSPTPTEQQ